MALKRTALEILTAAHARIFGRWPRKPDTSRIFVLRNNDLGDVLLATPLLHALREHFPESRIGVGVGGWAIPLLAHNPDIDEVVRLDAPWHNKTACPEPWNSPAGLFRAYSYLRHSPQIEALRGGRFTVGIDVLGSPQGTALFIAGGIPYRLGVRGYAGGHSGCQQALDFDPSAQVARFALGFAELLGASPPTDARPRITLSEEESAEAARQWKTLEEAQPPSPDAPAKPLRIVVAPGAGLEEKRWPTENFARLCRLIAECRPCTLAIVGAATDKLFADTIRAAAPQAHDLCGATGLRATFALTAQADLVLSNASMMLHVAAAFSVNNLVLLGPAFPSATAEASQWGYPDHYRVLGPEPGQPTVATADEAFAALAESGWI